MTAFAGIIIIIIGGWWVISGLVGLFNSYFYVVTLRWIFEFDISNLAWIHLILGIVILGIGTVLLSTMPSDIPYWQVTLYMVIVVVGIGPTMPLFTLAIQNAVDVARVGQATSATQF